MFPGGMDSERLRQLQDLARKAGEFEGIWQNENLGRQVQEAARLHAQWLQSGGRIPEPLPPGVMRSIQTVRELLGSPGFQKNVEEVRRVTKLADRRFGSEGFEAARQIAQRYLAANDSLEAGFKRATERIRDGYADEVLGEAITLASSPEAQRTIEQADRNALFGLLAEEQKEQGDETPGIEIRAGVDVETVIALAELTDEERQVLQYWAGQALRVLIFVVSSAQVSTDPAIALEQASWALAAAAAIYDYVRAANEAKSKK